MPGQRRSKDEWEQLLTEFNAVSENAADFCRARGISSSNFYKRRTSRATGSRPAFVAARRAAPPVSSVAVQINDVVIRCDTQTQVSWVSDLVTALRG